MGAALIWLVIGVLLIGAEVLSGDFVLVMLGVAALSSAGAASLGASPVITAAVFGLVSLGLVAGARPVLKRRLEIGVGHRSALESLPGSRAVVESTVDAHGGRVKIGGDVWSARSVDERVLEPGTVVTVVEISGATAVVLSEDLSGG
ncbi:NfeD family protein [Umezawaea beigongshangensis]|uniref:NfeD family protein n=1 Tax=Umezawaea beigongshangensis TaxID=2780383 RepID=UPI0018F17A50|nr:NfeD family protein [Umezawaea beigongshangensis]